MERERVVILGAGPAGLATAFGLSRTAELRARYDITIYQAGWRAGGKCSQGRVGPANRIEQNGTHYLFGCYENSFHTVREAYRELEAKGVDWFGSYEEAFIPRNLLVFKQHFNGVWYDWPLQLPTNKSMPGARYGHVPRPTDYISMALQWMIEVLAGWRALRCVEPPGPFDPSLHGGFLPTLFGPVKRILKGATNEIGEQLLRLALKLAGRLEDEWVGRVAIEGVIAICREVRRWLWWLLGSRVETDLGVNRTVTLLDFGLTGVIGSLQDRIWEPGGLVAIDEYEFRDWLRHHGVREVTLSAPFLTTWYDSIAAYEGGDVTRPNLAAGVSMNAITHAAFMYKGSFAYQMRAEIGDSFVAPIFECLRRRGVRFNFFHRIWDVRPGPDGRIGEIDVERQVELTSGDPSSYDPFIEVKGLKAWPGEPLWSQIEDADAVRGHDLESFYTPWRGETGTLREGEDFDTVVLALPVDCLRYYCREILEQKPDWRTMVDELAGVETQSLRLWFYPTLEEIGWTLGPPILSAYAQPFSTWEDNGHLVEVQTWPPDQTPHAMATVFGAMKAPVVAPGPDDTGYPKRQLEAAERAAMRFMEQRIGDLWPGATSASNPSGIDWSLLVDLEDRKGPERMRAQYVRANAGPVERYVQAQAGKTRHRLRTDESGFENLYLAGDWVRNGVVVGSVEGAIAAGLQASRAISGQPRFVVPDEDGPRA